MTAPLIAWTIHSSDSSSGDGLQSDILTFRDFAVHGCSVVTTVTARNSTRTDRSTQHGPDVVEAQFRSLAKDLPPATIKSGDLCMTGVVRAVAKYVEQIQIPLVCDPCAATPSGTRQVDPPTMEAIRNKLIASSSLFLPNVIEAEWFSGLTSLNENTIPEAARRILELGAASVLIKGGHLAGDFCHDYWSDGEHAFWLTSPRIPETILTGAGTAFAAAATAALAISPAVADALVLAKAYVNQGLRLRSQVGKGSGLFGHRGFPQTPEDLPIITATAQDALKVWTFKPLQMPMCPLMVSAYSADQATELIQAGVRNIRFVTDRLASDKRASDTAAATQAAHQAGARLFVAGNPDLAQSSGADGVILSPDSLTPAIATNIQSAGLLLGIEVQSFFDLSRAIAWQPSWVQIHSTTPDLQPAFSRIANFSDVPVIVSGAVDAEHLQSFLQSGIIGALPDTDLDNAIDPAYRLSQWIQSAG